MRNLLFTLALNLAGVSSVFAATYNADPVNYRSLLNNLVAGDTLVLAAGTYNSGLPVIDLHGTTGQPVIIIGPTNGPPAIFTPRSCCNTVQIKDSSYVEIRHLTVDGQNIEVDAVNSRGITHHITIANLRIINHGVSQSTIGISTKGPAWNWIIQDNIINDAGTGMYLGNSDGNLAFVNGLIERNLIVNTIGYNLQIKHQNPRPTGIGMPQTDSRTIIRHNVFSKGNNASGGGMARPNLLVGHFPLNGATGSNDLYEIYGNFFYQNPSEALFQGEGNIAFYNNLLVNDAGDALNVQPHNDVPRRIHIFRNTVVAEDSGISVTGGDSAYPQKIFANVVFAGRPVRATDETDNITDKYNAAATYLAAPTAAPGTLDLFPQAGKTTGASMDMALVQGFTDSNLDFDGRPLRNTDRGAYVDDGAGTSWLPQLQIKPTSITDALDVIPDDVSAWTEQGTVLTYGVPGSWDEKTRGLYPVGVHKKEGIYYLHYLAGFDGCWTVDGGVNHRSVGLATSTDGINFTKFSENPILKPHDFVPVHSHEEGIRTASIRYLPQKGMWLGYFGVESPGGADTCPFMGSEAQCGCNVEVDASIYAATSVDGKNWTVKGEVQGVYNGAENYVDDFQYVNGEYYLWSHRAQGGQRHNASKGTDYMNLTPLGEIPKWCWGWSELGTYLHNDKKTITAFYDPNGGCASPNKNNVYFATTSLDNMTVVSNERIIAQTGRISRIFQDTENGIWRWYYNGSGAQNGTIQLRTHPIETTGIIAPGSPAGEVLQITVSKEK